MQRRTEHFHSGGTERPMRDLLLQLPLLAARPGETIQYEEADAFLLVQIAENAEVATQTTMRHAPKSPPPPTSRRSGSG